MRYAVISGGIVANVILWDGATPYEPAEGETVVQSDTLQIGDEAP